MTQQQIASHLGTTREVVAKLMGEFVKLKYVRTYRGVVVIEKSDGLSKILTTTKS